MNPAGLAQYEQNYNQSINQPAIANLANSVYNNGQAYGSFGGGAVGQAVAQGGLNEYQAGLDYSQQMYNNVLQGRQSFFAGGPAIAETQNALGVQAGLGIAGLEDQNTQNQNQYNLGSAGMQNGFDQQNFGNQEQIYGMQQQAASNRALGVGGLISGAIGLGANAAGGLSGGNGLGNIFSLGSGNGGSGIAQLAPDMIEGGIE